MPMTSSYMVQKNPEIDLAIAEELGEMIYPGGGKEFLEAVRRVRAGEKLILYGNAKSQAIWPEQSAASNAGKRFATSARLRGRWS